MILMPPPPLPKPLNHRQGPFMVNVPISSPSNPQRRSVQFAPLTGESLLLPLSMPAVGCASNFHLRSNSSVLYVTEVIQQHPHGQWNRHSEALADQNELSPIAPSRGKIARRQDLIDSPDKEGIYPSPALVRNIFIVHFLIYSFLFDIFSGWFGSTSGWITLGTTEFSCWGWYWFWSKYAFQHISNIAEHQSRRCTMSTVPYRWAIIEFIKTIVALLMFHSVCRIALMSILFFLVMEVLNRWKTEQSILELTMVQDEEEAEKITEKTYCRLCSSIVSLFLLFNTLRLSYPSFVFRWKSDARRRILYSWAD